MGEYADYEVDRILDGFDDGAPGCYFSGGRAITCVPITPPNCPSCGRRPKATHTKFGWRRDCCGLWGWGKDAPLVSAETHAARQYAHKVFDSLWQSGLIGRSRAYALLAEELNLDPADCHMKLMDRETAERVPGAVHAISKRLRGVPI